MNELKTKTASYVNTMKNNFMDMMDKTNNINKRVHEVAAEKIRIPSGSKEKNQIIMDSLENTYKVMDVKKELNNISNLDITNDIQKEIDRLLYFNMENLCPYQSFMQRLRLLSKNYNKVFSGDENKLNEKLEKFNEYIRKLIELVKLNKSQMIEGSNLLMDLKQNFKNQRIILDSINKKLNIINDYKTIPDLSSAMKEIDEKQEETTQKMDQTYKKAKENTDKIKEMKLKRIDEQLKNAKENLSNL